MVGEDAEGIAASKGGYHWDKRHRKYVQLQPGEALRAGKRVRAESGVAVSPHTPPAHTTELSHDLSRVRSTHTAIQEITCAIVSYLLDQLERTCACVPS